MTITREVKLLAEKGLEKLKVCLKLVRGNGDCKDIALKGNSKKLVKISVLGKGTKLQKKEGKSGGDFTTKEGGHFL